MDIHFGSKYKPVVVATWGLVRSWSGPLGGYVCTVMGGGLIHNWSGIRLSEMATNRVRIMLEPCSSRAAIMLKSNLNRA